MWDFLHNVRRNGSEPATQLLQWILTAGAIFAATVPITQAHAEKDKAAYKEGKEQEARQNYEAAYEDYLRAYQAEPASLQYRAAVTRTRFLAAAAKVHRGVLLRQTGNLEESLTLLEAAAQIDPSSAIATQELKSTRSMIQHNISQAKHEESKNDASLSPVVLDAQGPVKLRSVANPPITLRLSEETNVVYDTVGKLAGLNVLFDPDCVPHRITIDLNGVTLEEALSLVAAGVQNLLAAHDAEYDLCCYR